MFYRTVATAHSVVGSNTMLGILMILKANLIRVVYITATLALVVLLTFYRLRIVSTQDSLNQFSFWTGLATLIALIVALGEIFHSSRTTKLIKDTIDKKLNEQARLSSSSLVVEISSLLDECSTHIGRSDYHSALRALQIARRFNVRIEKKFLSDPEKHVAISDGLDKAEKRIQVACHTSLGSPLTKRQQTDIVNLVTTSKLNIEQLA